MRTGILPLVLGLLIITIVVLFTVPENDVRVFAAILVGVSGFLILIDFKLDFKREEYAKRESKVEGLLNVLEAVTRKGLLRIDSKIDNHVTDMRTQLVQNLVALLCAREHIRPIANVFCEMVRETQTQQLEDVVKYMNSIAIYARVQRQMESLIPRLQSQDRQLYRSVANEMLLYVIQRDWTKLEEVLQRVKPAGGSKRNKSKQKMVTQDVSPKLMR